MSNTNTNNNLFDMMKVGFRVTIGATASLMETIQDPQKRQETLSQLQAELSRRTQEWVEKGEMTEQEARKTMEELFNQVNQKDQQTTSPTSPSQEDQQTEPSKKPQNSDDPESELRELTEQIVALRSELEQLEKPSNN